MSTKAKIFGLAGLTIIFWVGVVFIRPGFIQGMAYGGFPRCWGCEQMIYEFDGVSVSVTQPTAWDSSIESGRLFLDDDGRESIGVYVVLLGESADSVDLLAKAEELGNDLPIFLDIPDEEMPTEVTRSVGGRPISLAGDEVTTFSDASVGEWVNFAGKQAAKSDVLFGSAFAPGLPLVTVAMEVFVVEHQGQLVQMLVTQRTPPQDQWRHTQLDVVLDSIELE